jgi:hypothetical protein
MGGRGAMLGKRPSERVPEYKTVGYIAGIKVLEPIKGHGKLPEMSNTPNTKYILLDRKGDFKQLRTYDYSRHPVLDIEVEKKVLHIHYYKGDLGTRGGGKQETGRPLNRKELKKYGKILKEAKVKI